MREEKGADEIDLELNVIRGPVGGGVEPPVNEVGLGLLRKIGTELRRGGGFQKEPVGRGAGVGGGEVGLGFEDDLEGGGGEWWDEPNRRVDQELVGGGGLDLESYRGS